MYLLGLNLEVKNTGRPRVEQESRRRLAWAAFCLDGLVAGRVPELKSLPLSVMRVRLPANEREFQLGLESSSSQLALPYMPENMHRAGILACFISIMAIRCQILGCVLPTHLPYILH